MNTASDTNDRADRFTSHALVEVKKYKWFPMGTQSAVLLDISTSGFKVEFTGEAKARPGQKLYLDIPLTPLGIHAPKKLSCRAECKWFDDKKFRFGGVFIDLDQTEIDTITQVVESLKARGVSTL